MPLNRLVATPYVIHLPKMSDNMAPDASKGALMTATRSLVSHKDVSTMDMEPRLDHSSLMTIQNGYSYTSSIVDTILR